MSKQTARVGEAYDGVAELYESLFAKALDQIPSDRAMLEKFSRMVRDTGNDRVLDAGCGPGHVTGYLDSVGFDATGTDSSQRMIELARLAKPEIGFTVGHLEHLPLPDGCLGGLLSRYSTIHLSPPELPAVIAELARVLMPGGYLLMNFQGADSAEAHGTEFDHKVTAGYRWHADRVTLLMADAGLAEVEREVRTPEPDERFDQVSMLARRNPD